MRPIERMLCKNMKGIVMKDKLFEAYYKHGFDHFIFKNLLKLKRPKMAVQIFYLSLITAIIAASIIFG